MSQWLGLKPRLLTVFQQNVCHCKHQSNIYDGVYVQHYLRKRTPSQMFSRVLNTSLPFLRYEVFLHGCTEAYLETSRTSTMELFGENSQRLLAPDYFRKKASSQMFDWVLNTPLMYYRNLKFFNTFAIISFRGFILVS